MQFPWLGDCNYDHSPLEKIDQTPDVTHSCSFESDLTPQSPVRNSDTNKRKHRHTYSPGEKE